MDNILVISQVFTFQRHNKIQNSEGQRKNERVFFFGGRGIWGVYLSIMRKSGSVSHSVVSDSLWPYGLWPTRLFSSWNSPGKNTAVGSHSLLQGIFPTQGLNPGLLHCRQILYPLSNQGSPYDQKSRVIIIYFFFLLFLKCNFISSANILQ